jgi:hypothetical protein
MHHASSENVADFGDRVNARIAPWVSAVLIGLFANRLHRRTENNECIPGKD